MTHGRHKRFTFTVQNVDHTNFFNGLQFMLLTAGTQPELCKTVNEPSSMFIKRFAVYIYGHLPICKNFFHKFDKLECFHISELLVINV